MKDNIISWLPLDSHRVTAFSEDGEIILIKPKEINDVVPLFCPCCKFPMQNNDDTNSFRSSGVCYPCDLKWFRPFGKTYHIGYIPEKQELWYAYITDREQRSKPNIVF